MNKYVIYENGTKAMAIPAWDKWETKDIRFIDRQEDPLEYEVELSKRFVKDPKVEDIFLLANLSVIERFDLKEKMGGFYVTRGEEFFTVKKDPHPHSSYIGRDVLFGRQKDYDVFIGKVMGCSSKGGLHIVYQDRNKKSLSVVRKLEEVEVLEET